jgi:hypothetical protein
VFDLDSVWFVRSVWGGGVADFGVKGFFGGNFSPLSSVFFSLYALHSCCVVRVLGGCNVWSGYFGIG